MAHFKILIFALLASKTQCQDYNDQHQTFKLVNGVNLTSPFLKTIKTVDGTPNGNICGALCLKESHSGRCCNGFQVNTEYQCTLYHNVYHKTSEGPDNIYSTNLWHESIAYPRKLLCPMAPTDTITDPAAIFLLNGNICRQSSASLSCQSGVTLIVDGTKLFCMGGEDQSTGMLLRSNEMIDTSLAPEEWVVETKEPLLEPHGARGFGLIQYERKIFLFAGYKGDSAGNVFGTGSVHVYYIDEDRWEDTGILVYTHIKDAFHWVGQTGLALLVNKYNGRWEAFDMENVAKYTIVMTNNLLITNINWISQWDFTLKGKRVHGILFMSANSHDIHYLDAANPLEGPKLLDTVAAYTGSLCRFYGYPDMGVNVKRFAGSSDASYPMYKWYPNLEKFQLDNCGISVPAGKQSLFKRCITNQYIDSIPCI